MYDDIIIRRLVNFIYNPHLVSFEEQMVKYCPFKDSSHKGNGKYKGPFAFTLTKSPKDNLTVADMLLAARKIMKQKSCLIARYAWYYEDIGRDDNGDAIHPHIHGMYETYTQGRIEAKHWARYWPIWNEKTPIGAGFRGGYHREVFAEESYDKYIKGWWDGGVILTGQITLL